MNILVVSGDKYDERVVSLSSGKAVLKCLNKLGHKVYNFDPKNGYTGLDKYIGKVDVVFPILHGEGGEDGQIQQQLEQRHFKYLGSDVKASKLCIDKIKTIEIITKLGITTPVGEIVSAASYKKSKFTAKPYALKPINGGSSIDAYIVRDFDDDIVPISVFKRHPKMLIEELILGTEITVSILGSRALPVIEIVPPKGGEFDYKNKYNGKTKEICPPKTVAKDLQLKAQKIAQKIHESVGARHISRTDMIITPLNQLYVLEINTMPGLTAASLYPKAAKAAGLNFEQLMQRFIEMAQPN